MTSTHDVGDDLVWDKLAVPVPIFPVLLTASFIIPHLSVEQENNEEGQVKVGNGGVESGRQAP